MQNFFEQKKQNTSTNPFAQKVQTEFVVDAKQSVKRLNIIDADVLNSSNNSSELESMKIRMDSLYQIINQKSQNLDPITLEKMKMEWEDLREKIYKISKKELKDKKNISPKNYYKPITYGFKKILTLIKMYSPKVKKIVNMYNDINKEVEDLLKRTTPHGEEEMKYGLLVNKIYQASKLNEKLSNEIK